MYICLVKLTIQLTTTIMTTGQIIFAIIGAAVAITGLTITGVGIMLRRARKKGADGQRLDTVEKKFEDLKCNEHQKTVHEIQLDIAEIRGDIKLLMVKIDNKENPFSKRKSPISLTELGIKTSVELKIKEKIATNWNAISSIIDQEVKDKNAYDIQEYCIRLATIDLGCLFTPKDVEEIKLYAFNQGNNIAEYGSMIGILLRDEYFKRNNINVGEVDKFDPNALKK